jgi:hypothetical protein
MPVFLAAIPWWVKSLPTFVSVVLEVTKFCIGLKDKKEAQSCAIAIEKARKEGDTTKLEQLIEKMKRGESCDQ